MVTAGSNSKSRTQAATRGYAFARLQLIQLESGMMAANAAFEAITAGRSQDELTAYQDAYDASDIKKELKIVRNVQGHRSQ